MNTKYGLPRQVNPDSSLGFYRSYYGFSQQRLADESGAPLRAIQKLESGNFHVAAYHAELVANFIGISMHALICDRLEEIISHLVAPPTDPQAKENFLKKQEQAIDTGKRGENIVADRERAQLEGTAYAKAVTANPANDPDLGYDVLSFSSSGKPKYIEVKTTKLGCDRDFYISSGELEFMMDSLTKGRLYELHRVYDLKDDGSCGVEVYTPEELLKEFDFIPCQYIVRRKGGDRA